MVTGFEFDNQRIQIELVKAINELVKAVQELSAIIEERSNNR